MTFEEANYIFKVRIQQVRISWKKPLTWLKYPVSWTRWGGVQILGKEAWNSYGGTKKANSDR